METKYALIKNSRVRSLVNIFFNNYRNVQGESLYPESYCKVGTCSSDYVYYNFLIQSNLGVSIQDNQNRRKITILLWFLCSNLDMSMICVEEENSKRLSTLPALLVKKEEISKIKNEQTCLFFSRFEEKNSDILRLDPRTDWG